MFKKTLIPVAYGERPGELGRIGKFLEDLGSRSICLFHVDEPASLFRGADPSWLTRLAGALGETGLAVEVRRGDGHIASAIAEAALLEEVDGIFMKTKRRWHIETVLLGSVSRNLLRLSDVPVFIQKARPRLSSDGNEPGREDMKILYATDLDEASTRLLPYMMGFQGAWCHILHVRGRRADPAAERQRGKVVDEEMHRTAEDLRPYFDRVTTEQRIGNPATQVLHVSEQIGADVIALGRRRRAFFSAPLGATAERIVTGSKASIFLVPHPGGPRDP
ncbi:MAG: universal stress protein [Methanoculleus sp.]